MNTILPPTFSAQPENEVQQLLLNLTFIKEQEFIASMELILSLEEEITLLKEGKNLYPSIKLMQAFPESFPSWEFLFILDINRKSLEELSEKQLACLEKIKTQFLKRFSFKPYKEIGLSVKRTVKKLKSPSHKEWMLHLHKEVNDPSFSKYFSFFGQSFINPRELEFLEKEEHRLKGLMQKKLIEEKEKAL